LDLYPTYHPTGGVQVLQKASYPLSDGLKASNAEPPKVAMRAFPFRAANDSFSCVAVCFRTAASIVGKSTPATLAAS